MKNISICIINCLLLFVAGLQAQHVALPDTIASDSLALPVAGDSVFVQSSDYVIIADSAAVADMLPETDSVEVSPKKRRAAKSEADTVKIYKGVTLKIDLFTPIYTWFANSGEIMSYEALVHVNLLNRYFPTVEGGYAHIDHTAKNEARFNGGGVFARVGADFNLMKKNRESGNYFLGGVRFGMAQQKYSITNISITDGYWKTTSVVDFPDRSKFDCWAEIVGGAHVKIYKGFNMGWSVRFKFLFTRAEEVLHTWYIPGFGYKNNTTFGFNYYIGYTF